MEVNEAIRTKRAVRQFSDKAVPDNAIEAILNAGRRSPTASNKQYLTFIAIKDKDVQAQIATTAPGAKHLGNAAFVVAIASSDVGLGADIIHFDIGQAAAYMMLEAWEQGVSSNVALMRDAEGAKAALHLPDGVSSEWAISFGYPAQEEAATAPPKAGGRKSLDEVVKWNSW